MLVLGRDRIARSYVLHTADRDDLTRRCRFDVLTLICVHHHQTADALFRILDRVVNVGTGIDRTGVDTDKSELAKVLVRHQLEDEARERSLCIGFAGLHFTALRVLTLDRRNIKRARKEVDNSIKKRLNAFILKGRAGNDRNKLEFERTFTKGLADLVFRDLFAFEVLHH
ncbi:MAG: hypothetical protein JFAIHJKO_02244 [Pyrinomonadaceae bacterium]|nr:hypothetical protein [Pyrinomonadaceae bacterium]